MPLNLLVLLQTISLTSLILPTAEKNSSTSLARHRCDSCMTKMVLASRSSGVSTGWGGDLLRLRLRRGDRPRPPRRPRPPPPPPKPRPGLWLRRWLPPRSLDLDLPPPRRRSLLRLLLLRRLSRLLLRLLRFLSLLRLLRWERLLLLLSLLLLRLFFRSLFLSLECERTLFSGERLRERGGGLLKGQDWISGKISR